MAFRKDFIWGAATCAYQIEGAAYEDGKGLNIWDTFCKEEGRIRDKSSGDVACDHYHLFEEDVRLMKEIGINSYRFSISWARVLPDGTGRINQKGIDFYNKLINCLLENGIEPYITLYHWDTPYELHKKGDWLNPESADWFAEYAALVGKCFGDRVRNYMTFNEPQIFVGCGYQQGKTAPGFRLSARELMQITHNVLCAHGAAVKALRENCAGKINVGFVTAITPPVPATDSEADRKAAEKAYAASDINNFIFCDTTWLDPIVFGKYPDSLLRTCADIMPEGFEKDMALINQPIDFIAHNIYFADTVKADENGEPRVIPPERGASRTAIGWNIEPDALYYGAMHVKQRYGLPYYITENGMSAHDWVSLDGKVHDPNRIDYLTRYLRGLKRAADEGCDVRGYFEWSLLDNFEWTEGYCERFGIVYVDYQTQKRTLKDSAFWYGDVIRSNGENL